MQYFTEQGRSHQEVDERVRMKYGDSARVLTRRTIHTGGFLGLFMREGIEVTGYIAQDAGRKRSADMEAEKQKILLGVKNDQTIQKVLEEVQSVKELLGKSAAVPAVSGPADKHPACERIETIMLDNDFSRSYISVIIDRLRREFSLGDLEDQNMVQSTVMDWIGESIRVYQDKPAPSPRIFILVGPTGVGKTTTIAKLAAMHRIGTNGESPKEVRMLTVDNYRIGARTQIETYGEIMEIPVFCAESCQELRKKLALFDDADLILIDTIGKSPRQSMMLAEMKELLSACGERAEVHLAMSATTKTSDIGEILQQFEPFRYRSVILTKLDETMRIGNIISVLSERQKPISYLTDGQVVPQDICRVSVPRLLMNLEGFRVDKNRIEKKFGSAAVAAAGQGNGREWI